VTPRATQDGDGGGERRSNLSHVWQSVDPPSALVLGFGNILLGDDGAGVQLVQRLRAQLPTSDCEFVDGGTMSFSLLSYVETASAMLVVDAAELASPPGTTVLFEGEAMDNFLKSARRRTVHEMGLVDLLDMARLENCLPQRRALLCIQPAFVDWSETLSPLVDAALAGASAQARELLERWCIA
jgi:hydrogenase maturation protease